MPRAAPVLRRDLSPGARRAVRAEGASGQDALQPAGPGPVAARTGSATTPPAGPSPVLPAPAAAAADGPPATPLGIVAWSLGGGAELATAVGIAIAATAVYLFTAPGAPAGTDYFVRLADAFLQGRVYLTESYPWLSELIPRDGVFYVAYPPMPAVVLMPFVAVFGIEFHQQVASCLFAGISVGLAWLAMGRFALTPAVRALLTVVFGFGTCLWYTAETGSAWYLAHTVAVMFAMGTLVLVLSRRWALLAGLLLGCATVARLPVGLTAPFFLAMAAGLAWPLRWPDDRRATIRAAVLFCAGLAVPVAMNALYNVARWGTPIDVGYTLIPGVLDEPYYQKGILAFEYIPRHLYAIFFRSWNYVDELPFLQPSNNGLGLFFTTPLFLWLVRARLSDPRVVWAIIAIALALVPIVTHGNIGFSQFGYRFSLDVQPLLFVILATVFERGTSRLAWAAGAAAVAFNLYGVWAMNSGFVNW